MKHPRVTPKVQGGSGTHGALPLALVVVAMMLTAALVGLVRVKSKQVEAGYRINDLRQQLVSLEQERSVLDVEKHALARPSRLAHLARTQLGLVPPDLSNSIANEPNAFAARLLR